MNETQSNINNKKKTNSKCLYSLLASLETLIFFLSTNIINNEREIESESEKRSSLISAIAQFDRFSLFFLLLSL